MVFCSKNAFTCLHLFIHANYSLALVCNLVSQRKILFHIVDSFVASLRKTNITGPGHCSAIQMLKEHDNQIHEAIRQVRIDESKTRIKEVIRRACVGNKRSRYIQMRNQTGNEVFVFSDFLSENVLHCYSNHKDIEQLQSLYMDQGL